LPRKDALAKFGITDRPDLRVQVIEQQHGPSLVDVHGTRDPVKAITPKQAIDLSKLLRDAGEEALGQAIAAAPQRPKGATVEAVAPGPLHKTTSPPPRNGHAALAGHQQYRSTIKDRPAPPLFRVGSRVAKRLRVGQNLALVGPQSRPGHFSPPFGVR
jgi:hypothetical protein